jgi:hypothetical protein
MSAYSAYSGCIRKFGAKEVVDTWARFIGDNGGGTISVGSGNGALEKLLGDDHNIDVVCVDPDPESWTQSGYIHLAPQFRTVQHMLEEQPDIINDHMTLLLVTPAPCEMDYDIQSIELLNPYRICIISELTGSCSSSRFWKWYERLFGEADDSKWRHIVRNAGEHDEEKTAGPEYGHVFYHEKDAGGARYVCIVLEKGADNEACVKQVDQIAREEDDCCIM